LTDNESLCVKDSIISNIENFPGHSIQKDIKDWLLIKRVIVSVKKIKIIRADSSTNKSSRYLQLEAMLQS